jgi:hypothetical protein
MPKVWACRTQEAAAPAILLLLLAADEADLAADIRPKRAQFLLLLLLPCC